MAQQPIRVAQVIGKLANGGVESVVYNYYRAMDHTQVQFDFFVNEDSKAAFPDDLIAIGARVYRIPPYQRVFQYHKALYALFRQNRYRIVHAHVNTMNLFPLFAAWRAGVPVRICHNHSTAHWGEGAKTLLKYILRPFNKLFATDWFACGERAGRWMYGDRAFNAGNVTVMPNAIDTAKFAYDAGARIALRQEFGIPRDAFVVGHVGRFMYQKNHALMLRVFAELLKTKSAAWLLLIGEGELEEQIRHQAQAFGLQKKVIFTGARRDVNKLYSVMDVFCLPSFYEGMPVVAWEAQANGLRCVLADTMTREAAVLPAAQFMGIKQPAAAWAEQLIQNQGRLNNVSVPDIQHSAGTLQKFYRKKQEHDCDRR